MLTALQAHMYRLFFKEHYSRMLALRGGKDIHCRHNCFALVYKHTNVVAVNGCRAQFIQSG
jgi:hypothetical protein